MTGRSRSTDKRKREVRRRDCTKGQSRPAVSRTKGTSSLDAAIVGKDSPESTAGKDSGDGGRFDLNVAVIRGGSPSPAPRRNTPRIPVVRKWTPMAPMKTHRIRLRIRRPAMPRKRLINGESWKRTHATAKTAVIAPTVTTMPSRSSRRIPVTIEPGPTRSGTAIGDDADLEDAAGIVGLNFRTRRRENDVADGEDGENDASRDPELVDVDLEDGGHDPAAGEGHHQERPVSRADDDVEKGDPGASVEVFREVGKDREVTDRVDDREKREKRVEPDVECHPPSVSGRAGASPSGCRRAGQSRRTRQCGALHAYGPEGYPKLA
jgi:hypothetical protein